MERRKKSERKSVEERVARLEKVVFTGGFFALGGVAFWIGMPLAGLFFTVVGIVAILIWSDIL